jgi:alginate O-acetyltransferase complex protein AlgI
MLFNSIDFALFLPIVFSVYWFVVKSTLRIQNLWIVLASYVFYGWWDYRFLLLILFSTLLDYIVGIALNQQHRRSRRKMLLWASICLNLGLLSIFKYFNFFAQSFGSAFTFMGAEINIGTLDIILPVGISFYTFQTLSYTIDVYRRKIQPTRDLIAFAAYVSFFPQLIAGPIERASHLLPQFCSSRRFDYGQAVHGLRQFLWGLFKKVVIADNCAFYTDIIFNNAETHSGSTLAFGAFLFSFQIYGDFSGYSDMAIGIARLFGIKLMQNFAYPFFSRDIAEFWRRWHISLTSWFKDYVYIPLGGSWQGMWKSIRNVVVIFLITGLWHGANWTFIAWGALNAVYFLPLLLLGKHRVNIDTVAAGKFLPSPKEVLQIVGTFCLVAFSWFFFRAESITHSWDMFSALFSSSFLSMPQLVSLKLLALIGVFLLIEWLGREEEYALEKMGKGLPRPIRYAGYYLLIFVIFFYSGEQQNFIYFQF